MVPRRFRPRRKMRPRSTLSRLTKPVRQTAIQTLAKQVKALKASMKKDQQIISYSHTMDENVLGDLNYFKISAFSAWTDTFGAGGNDDDVNNVVWKSAGIDCYITHQSVNDEEENVTYTAFLVSLRDDIGSGYSPSTGNLVLTSGQAYVIKDGMAMLNKKIFKIHKVKRFTLGNFGQALYNSAGQKQYGNDIRWYWKISPNAKIVNPTGDWRLLGSSPDPSKAYYVLLFNNNSGGDLEWPRIRIQSVCTVQTP